MAISRRLFLHGLVACAAAGLLAANRVSANASPSTYSAAFAGGVAFLTTPQPAGQYSTTLHLLREAPEAAPCKYWLFNDNALAGHLLARLGHPLAATLLGELRTRGRETNGLHEVLWGVRIGDSPDWCPRTHYYVCFSPEGDDARCDLSCGDIQGDTVCTEERHGNPMTDWEAYADLAFYGALNQKLLGALDRARGTFQTGMAMFDGAGFIDLADTVDAVTERGYTTYKIGLALHVGLSLGCLDDARAQILGQILVDQQESAVSGKVGGFYTHYGQPGRRTCDVNTETTALALWGLYNLAYPYRAYLPFVRS
jgi:hypothetical protein